VTKARTISVSVPMGIDENATLRLTGQGEASSEGGPPGNLYVKIRVEPHPIFTRSGKTIHSEIGVNVAQAALGDELEIDTIDGPVEFKLPSGTQSAQQFRLRGKGAPDIRGGDRGDQIVTVHVLTPRNLTPEQRELFQALGETMGSEIQEQPEERPSFFSKIRDAIGSFLM
jgi:molecular chaperone DnaJ